MSYLVIGGTGFTGSHLVRTLVERGYDVVIFSPSGNTSRLGDVARTRPAENGEKSACMYMPHDGCRRRSRPAPAPSGQRSAEFRRA